MLKITAILQNSLQPLRTAFRRTSSRVIALVSFLGLILFSLVILVRPSFPYKLATESGTITPSPLKNDVPLHVHDLINAIKETTKVAAGDLSDTQIFSASEREIWHRNNPCQSRYELRPMYALRRLAKDVDTNPQWAAVLVEYAKLHRTCIRKIGNITEFFLLRKSVDGCQFVVADTARGTGLGNKALSVVSAMLYAVLTRRVLLVPVATAIPDVMCEPFEGSSWTVDPNGLFTPAKSYPHLWAQLGQFHKQIDFPKRGSEKNPSIYAGIAVEAWDCQPHPRFFCDTEQAYYSQMSWIYFRECLYFVPKLFAIPSFRPVLEALFPDRWTLPHLLRSVMLPSDPVWSRVRQVNDVHLRHADRRVGIQVRYFHGIDDFNLLHGVTNAAVERCVVECGLLPNPTIGKKSFEQETAVGPGNDSTLPSLSPLRVSTVFITSLHESLRDRLTQIYVRQALPKGEGVGVIQLTHEDQQYFGDEVDRQALTEILSLSLSDYLVLTPQSTFGALAQGYGALTPWFIDIRPETSTPCVRGHTPETCYQIPNTKIYSCPHDVGVNGKVITDVVPYIKDCHSIEKPFSLVNGAGLGFQLIASRNESRG